jgi:hypothetical protein
MFNLTSNQGNVNKNHNEMSFNIHQAGKNIGA